MNYNEYLNSPEWKERRNRILKRDRFQCRMCGSGKNLRVHHIHYPEILGTESDEDLITVCDSCHKKIHGNDLRKRPNWRIDIERRKLWAHEAKLQDFLYGGERNMCSLPLLKKSLQDFNARNGFALTSGTSDLQGALGYAHWKLTTEMFRRGYTPEEITMLTPLDIQKVTRYLTKDRSGQERQWNYVISQEEINMMVRRYIEDDLHRRK